MLLAAATQSSAELSPALVQGAGILIILATCAYAITTGKVLTPLLGSGGALVGLGQYLGVVRDIKGLLRDLKKDDGS